MELNSAIKDRVSNLLSDPAAAAADDVSLLTELVEQYPYFSPARLLLARASGVPEEIAKAAFMSNGALCYHVLNIPAQPQLTPVTAAEDMPEAEQAQQAIAKDAETEEPVFEEIAEFDISEFAGEAFEQAPLTRGTENLPEQPADAPEIETAEREQDEEIFQWELPEKQPVAMAPEIETVTPDEPEHASVSKYDDENLPYSFLWWLSRTRAAHREVFQPYASPAPANAPAPATTPISGELQQQYVEHIFHLQTGLVEEDESRMSVASGHEDKIISAFLEKDPQIKPPSVDKLDNENKARKSAEDHNDVVSETLASIYIEQMLYRKAIDTYEKLSLKFPEKSRYFADLIKSLEKKI